MVSSGAASLPAKLRKLLRGAGRRSSLRRSGASSCRHESNANVEIVAHWRTRDCSAPSCGPEFPEARDATHCGAQRVVASLGEDRGVTEADVPLGQDRIVMRIRGVNRHANVAIGLESTSAPCRRASASSKSIEILHEIDPARRFVDHLASKRAGFANEDLAELVGRIDRVHRPAAGLGEMIEAAEDRHRRRRRWSKA